MLNPKNLANLTRQKSTSSATVGSPKGSQAALKVLEGSTQALPRRPYEAQTYDLTTNASINIILERLKPLFKNESEIYYGIEEMYELVQYVLPLFCLPRFRS